uniref:UBC core domain-containing protein n=1 Tax=Meloidogyne floridensis TaxID=298350 RepID=A0A915P0I1_9BILA
MSGGSATITAVTRLKKDYQKLVRDPVPYAIAAPLPSNILEWHYVVIGAPDTPYEGGYYHGKLVFPQDFPFRPPSIYMLTPSGRFQDTWNPSWSVSTIIMGLISFMNENSPTLGSLLTSDYERRILARRSREFNLKSPQFCEVFSELAEQIRCELEEERALNAESNSGNENVNNQTTRPSSSSITANLLMVTGVVILIFAVRYVVMNATSA